MAGIWSLFSSSQPEKLGTYTVVKVNIEEYVLQDIVDGYLDGGLRLHKVNVNATTWDFNIVLETTNGSTFSIYRSGDLAESQAYFLCLKPILPVLVVHCSEEITLTSLPQLTEHIRTHAGQTLLHFAAHFGFLKLFTKALAYDYIDGEDAESGQTPLHVAIQSGKLATVQAMLALNPQLDPIDSKGNNVLHYAVKSANLPVLKEILSRCQACLQSSTHNGASAYKSLLNALNNAGQTALAIACQGGPSGELLVKELLGRGANLHGAVRGVTAEYIAQHVSSCIPTGSSSASSTANLWSQLSANLDSKAFKNGGTPLHWCTGNSAALSRWLELSVDVNARNLAGQTALHVAIGRVDLGAVVLLLSSGADVNAREEDESSLGGTDGDTPLHLAVKRALKPSSSPTIPLSSPSSLPFCHIMAILQAIIVFGGEVNALARGKGGSHQEVTARHLVATSERSALRDQLLYVLHSVHASRCLRATSGASRDSWRQESACADGCVPTGNDFNGTPFDTPSNICLRSSPLYDSLLMGPVIEAALKELETAAKMEKEQSEGWFSSLSRKDTKKKKGKRLKLLSLDGGGIRGLITIQLMDFLERASGRKIVDIFDWIAGTSTGGILALMLAAGFPVTECRQIYFRFKDEVFVGSRPHPSDKLEAFLQRYLGTERRMRHLESEADGDGASSSKPHIMIPVTVVDYFPPELKIFRSYQGPEDLMPSDFHSPSDSTPSSEELCWKVARATGAAPSFFNKFEGRYLDGGLIANNPTLDLMSEVQKMSATVRQIRRSQAGCDNDRMEDDSSDDPSSSSPSIGLVVSIGTGLSPAEPFNALESISWSSLTTYSGLFDGYQLLRVLAEQTTSTDSHVTNRAQAWCAGLSASYFRLNPPLSESLELNETDNVKLVHMLWQTMAYAHRHQERLLQLVTLMSEGDK